MSKSNFLSLFKSFLYVGIFITTISNVAFSDGLGNEEVLTEGKKDISKIKDNSLLWVDLNTTKAIVSSKSPVYVKINDFNIIGPKKYKFDIYTNILESYIGKLVDFNVLKNVVTNIGVFYKNHGYPVNFAFIPGQHINNGVVTIVLVEVKYDNIIINNKTSISNNILKSYFAGEQPGRNIDINVLNKDLLSTSEFPYTQINTVLSPGTKPATSNLTVNATEQKYVGSVGISDYGDPYLGSMVLSAYAQVNNLLGIPDTLNVSGMSSFGGFNTGRIAYDALLNKYGTHIGAYYSAMNYRLGLGITPINYPANENVVSSLGSSGYGQVMGVYVKHPILRTKNSVIAAKMIYEHDIWSDTISQALGQFNNRYIDSITAEIDGDIKHKNNETTFMGSLTPYNLSTTSKASIDPYASTDQGIRYIWKAIASTTQNLENNNQFYLSASGQLSSGGSIDPMEEMVFGGENSIRAYPTAVLFAASGVTLNAELRHFYTYVSNTVEPFAFFDAGGFTYAGDWYNLFGPGLGVVWNYLPWDVSSKFEIAMPIGYIPYMVGSPENYQAWFSVTKNFK